MDVMTHPFDVKPIVFRMGKLGQAVASHVQANPIDVIAIVLDKHVRASPGHSRQF